MINSRGFIIFFSVVNINISYFFFEDFEPELPDLLLLELPDFDEEGLFDTFPLLLGREEEPLDLIEGAALDLSELRVGRTVDLEGALLPVARLFGVTLLFISGRTAGGADLVRGLE